MKNRPRDDTAVPEQLVAAKAVKPAKSSATSLFPKPRDERRSALTHTQIEQDLAAFERAGGRIEVLGNTFTFKNLRPSTPSSTHTPPVDAQTDQGDAAG